MTIDKQTFIKLVPRRYIPNTEITGIGGNQYTTTFVPVEPEKVYRNNGTKNPTELSFSWNDGTLTFTTGSSVSNNIFADYPLYFCTSKYHYVEDNPVTQAGGVKEWKPRVKGNDSFKQDVTDMLAGVVSSSSSSFTLLNNDYDLNQYLTKFDNYKNRDAFSYGKLGDTYQYLYRGIITGIVVGDSIKFTVKAPNRLFDYDASLGNADRHLTYNSSDYPSIEAEMEGQVIPYSYGPLSRLPATVFEEKFDDFVSEKIGKIKEIGEVLKGAYIGSNTWALGVVDQPWSMSSLDSFTVTHLGSYQIDGEDYQRYSIPSNIMKYMHVGQIFPGRINGGSPSVGRALGVDLIDYSLNQVSFAQSNGFHIPLVNAYLIAAMVFRDDQFSKAGRLVPIGAAPNATIDPLSYLSYEVTNSGQYLIKYTYLGTNLPTEIGYSLLSKARSQTSFIQKYIESTGKAIDSTTFSQAQSQSNTYVMSVVNDGGRELNKTLDPIQDIVAINNGILYYDHVADKYKYKIVNEALSGVDWEVSDTDILEPNLVPKLDYSDTITRVILRHSKRGDGVAYVPQSEISTSSSFGITFNEEEKSESFAHNLEDCTAVAAPKLNLRAVYNTFYEFTLMADNYFDMNVGDIVRINNLENKILNGGEYIDVIILGISKSVERVRLKTYDFSKIP